MLSSLHDVFNMKAWDQRKPVQSDDRCKQRRGSAIHDSEKRKKKKLIKLLRSSPHSYLSPPTHVTMEMQTRTKSFVDGFIGIVAGTDVMAVWSA